MTTKRLSILRDQIQRNTKRELLRLEAKHEVKITSAAKRELVSGISGVFRETSPDLFRIREVRVTRGRIYRKRGREYRTTLVNDEINMVKKTRDSVAEVIKVAAQIAKKESSRNTITIECMNRAITRKWCEVWPICNVRTSRKLDLSIRKEENNE